VPMQIDVEEDKEYAAQKKEEQSLQRKRKANILNVQAQDNDLELPDDSTVYDTSSFDSLEPTKIDLPGLKKFPPRKVKGKCRAKTHLLQGASVAFVGRRWVVSPDTPTHPRRKELAVAPSFCVS
jgi:hypothetical protein